MGSLKCFCPIYLNGSKCTPTYYKPIEIVCELNRLVVDHESAVNMQCSEAIRKIHEQTTNT